MRIPEKIELDSTEEKTLATLMAKQRAIQDSIAMFQRSCEERMVQVSQENKEFWSAFATKHGIDIRNVSWAVSPDGKTAVPVQMNLVANAADGGSGQQEGRRV